jgi:NDP-sugar pyrophosphorylase family protein
MTTRPTVVILAAGENSRFFPFNTTLHKASYEILGEPLIVRTLRNLEAHHFYDVVLIVSEKDYGGKGLSAELQKYDLYLRMSFVLQPQALGMGNALLLAAEQIGESFAVVFPSSIDAGKAIEDLMKSSGEDGAIVVSETIEPWLYGIVTIDGDRITGIVEKPERGSEPSNLKAQGIYLLSTSYIDELRNVPPAQYSFEHAFDRYVRQHDVRYFKQGEALPSLKYPWHLFDFQQYVFGLQRSFTASDADVAPTSVIDDTHGPVIIESGARIGHGAKLLGPCYIGRHAFVGDFSFVRGSSIEEDVVVGSYTEVVRSIIFPKSEIHYGYVADSIIGRQVRIGAGLITANKRHDRENVHIIVKGEKVDAGRNNLGVLVGDRTKLSVRTTTMPGVAIGADSLVFPSMTLFKNIEHGETVK